MKKISVKVILAIGFSIFLVYLLLPNSTFPVPPPGSLQSGEKADTETPLRRAYFTNYAREEVLRYYKSELSRSRFLGIPLPTYRLNYPPEDAFSLIRDQTRSTFLEEIVNPLKESLFVNGFEPKDPKDAIFIENKFWRQKITVKFVPSNMFIRIIINILGLMSLAFLLNSISREVREFRK
ncbi:hypothetical protein A3D00_05035 [Candidatus Woesebacteria bacterium RIFCSPHIGHO2_02_FULL_38_9]|uniref:Uncharacterized protein n=1 Tax=Candidatus Woesebacteria bacterium RIFCSPHIGHO2_01_FULL_39_28 TaxID=1802496 RepID=A0A1F7YC68_9BACT|nr:MAG: hypothetical protein A2627_02900 [Candidatus Woesebacteria bacterium RIFCSPHIGHO2_01_FULL_39_28]OGM32353.1 MAG: hypothetical protein A3D00_05035 [Candidatus Woesebacteria bacterium RIFCSPHIGHO2_02_FULL_38_9]OGM57996.1 MAG: hypothetical protein A3A50_01910 [Candidatus Woesebacteria bacterium RIFCSPLOWO2_01_FULL_38_20]